MIDVVQVRAHAGAIIESPGGLVSAIETGSEAAKQPGHGKICLAISVVHRRIENYRLTLLVGGAVTAPQIAMKKRRHGPVGGEEFAHAVQQHFAPLLQTATETIFCRKIQ